MKHSCLHHTLSMLLLYTVKDHYTLFVRYIFKMKNVCIIHYFAFINFANNVQNPHEIKLP